MIKEDLIAERIVIEVYQQMIRHFADHDPTTRIMIEGILRDEEEHASDLSDLLFIIDPRSGKTEGEDPGTHPLDLHHDEQSRQQSVTKWKASASGGSGAGGKAKGRAGGGSGLAVPTKPRRREQSHQAADSPRIGRSGYAASRTAATSSRSNRRWADSGIAKELATW